jgi:hypothetical protein
VLPGDRFCGYCAALADPEAEVPLALRPALTLSPPPAAVGGGLPQPVGGYLPPDEITAIAALANAARTRAEALDPRAPVPAKRHLDQGDIDAMFG